MHVSLWQAFLALFRRAPIGVQLANDLFDAQCILLEAHKQVEYHRAIVAAMQSRIQRIQQQVQQQSQSTEEGKSNDN